MVYPEIVPLLAKDTMGTVIVVTGVDWFCVSLHNYPTCVSSVYKAFIFVCELYQFTLKPSHAASHNDSLNTTVLEWLSPLGTNCSSLMPFADLTKLVVMSKIK